MSNWITASANFASTIYQLQEPDRVYHYFPDKRYDRDRRRNTWDRDDDLNSERGRRPYTSLREASSVGDLGDVAAVIERLEGRGGDSRRRRLVIRT